MDLPNLTNTSASQLPPPQPCIVTLKLHSPGTALPVHPGTTCQIQPSCTQWRQGSGFEFLRLAFLPLTSHLLQLSCAAGGGVRFHSGLISCQIYSHFPFFSQIGTFLPSYVTGLPQALVISQSFPSFGIPTLAASTPPPLPPSTLRPLTPIPHPLPPSLFLEHQGGLALCTLSF